MADTSLPHVVALVSVLMDIDLVQVLELLALGAVVGFVAGLLGVGGGMMLVPFLTFILSQRGVDAGAAVKMAIATSMATILFTSISSLWAHHRLGAVRWRLVRGLAPGIVLGGAVAAGSAFALLKGQGLALFFSLFIGYSAMQLLRDRKPLPGRQLPGRAGQAAVGATLGFISALLGAGGAFMSVPFMVWCNVPIRHAVGTSAALGLPIAAASVTGYVVSGWSLDSALPGAVGYLYLPALALVALASVCTAPWGARTAQHMEVGKLKRLFALLLLGLASYMGYQGLTG